MESHGIWKAQKSTNPASMFFFLSKRTLPLSACCRKTKQVRRFRVASCISGHVVSADVSPKYMNVMAWENAVSYVQPDAITPQLCRANDVGSWASVLAVVSKRRQQLPTLSGQQCWELSVRVGSGVQTEATTPNIVGPTMLGVVAFVLAVVSKRTQQLPTTHNRVCKRTQHVTSNNIGSWGPCNNVASVFPGLYKDKAGKAKRHFLPVNLLVSYLLRLRRKYPVLLENWDLLG